MNCLTFSLTDTRNAVIELSISTMNCCNRKHFNNIITHAPCCIALLNPITCFFGSDKLETDVLITRTLQKSFFFFILIVCTFYVCAFEMQMLFSFLKLGQTLPTSSYSNLPKWVVWRLEYALFLPPREETNLRNNMAENQTEYTNEEKHMTLYRKITKRLVAFVYYLGDMQSFIGYPFLKNKYSRTMQRHSPDRLVNLSCYSKWGNY